MGEKKIVAFFKEQVRAILERSASEPDGFRAYFEGREPQDDEILGLIAVSTTMTGELQVGDSFPTPLEALARLSRAGRAEICRAFRKQLRTCLAQLAAA
ncbi:MAG: hypothetical protein HYS33_07505 [Acidobacteria bacterium]|nr:hypothetical protein [Acidobacteriota bacterium]